MDNNKTVNSLLNVELPPSVDNAINNLSDKPTLVAGRIISDFMDITLGNISYLADKVRLKRSYNLEKYRQELTSSIEKIPPEKLLEPSIQITAQALEDSKYCISEKTLRDMFVSLISNSMNEDFSNYVHPSFSGIIKQMSVLNAQIIALFKNDSLPGLPVCQYCISLPGVATIPPLPEHIFLEIPEKAITPNSISLESLSRFGLISISYLEYLHDEKFYEKFAVHPFFTDLQKQMPFGKVSIKKGLVRLTPLGRSFVAVCIPD